MHAVDDMVFTGHTNTSQTQLAEPSGGENVPLNDTWVKSLYLDFRGDDPASFDHIYLNWR